jgi:uncharacterized protein (DUF1501 family)
MTETVSRRAFLKMLASLPLALTGPPAGLDPTFRPRQGPARNNLLVCLFLRGAADALNIIIPHGDEAYYAARPTLAIPRPDDLRHPPGRRTLDLDGFFGLHPALSALYPFWQNGQLAAIHAVGPATESRSHFVAMALLERGLNRPDGPASGWLGRHLATVDPGHQTPFRAVSLGQTVARSLRGPVPVTTMTRVQLPDERGGSPGAKYPDTAFGLDLRQAATLLKAEVGLEVACLDLGGWDTHLAQGGSDGLMARQLLDLAEGLAAFLTDLAAQAEQVLVVVMSEFGRGLAENRGRGTDHGQAGLMLVLGGKVNGGRVHGLWPGLAAGQQVGPGGLAATTDYRDILAEIIQRGLGNPQLAAIFPDYTPRFRGVIKA